MEAVFQWITTYGYGMLFLLLMLGVVGLPVPDETLLVFSGYLVSKGNFHALPTWIVAVCGSWCGITLSYTIGRTLGLGVVHKYGKYLHITQQRIDTVHRWFDRIGHWALAAGYFFAGVRHFTAIVAGTSGLRYVSFAAYAYTGGLLWVTTFLTVGYYIGENWKAIAESIHQYVLYGSIVVVAAAMVYWIWTKRKSNQARTSADAQK